MLLSACSAPYLIISQDNLADYPCNTSNKGVNVRIRNMGKIAFTNVNLKYGTRQMAYPGLKPGDATCYKNIPSIWTNNAIDVCFSKQKGYVKTLMSSPTDHVGEKEIKSGYVTLNVVVTSVHGELHYSGSLIVDK